MVVPPPRWRGALALALLVAVGLAIRLWLLPRMWVNPDEGAHLMDGRLVLDGLVPGADYSARQPLYVYALALWLRLFGDSLFAARALMVALDAGVGVLTYLIGRRLFDVRTGLVAAGILLLLPFSAVWAPRVHTEPLSTVLAALGVYLVIRAVQGSGGALALAGAGACFALGFYVRQSSLALPLATALVLVVRHGRKPRPILRDGAWLAGGFVAVAGLAIALYSRRLSAADLWAGPVNPLSLVWEALVRIRDLVGGAAARTGANPSDGFRVGTQSWARTLVYLRQVVSLNSVLLAGFAVFLAEAVVRIARPSAARPPAAGGFALAAAVLVGWSGCLALLYGYWVVHRGFFPQYFTEFLPPLAIGLAQVLVKGWDSWRGEPGLGPVRDLLPAIGAAACAIWLGSELPLRSYLGRAGLLAVVGLAATVTLLAAAWRRGRPKAARAAVAATLLGLAGANLLASGRSLRSSYEGPWTPATLEATAAYLRAHGAPGDEVMSGAVIWEFAAGLRPFAGISHPLEFLGGIDPEDRPLIERWLARQPPRFVVLDGYTELAYLRHLPDLARLLAERYQEVAVVPGSPKPVRIYARRS
jgi:4-amino-4-deoxy-L-arabinose transferase-like glycosyltransferase